MSDTKQPAEFNEAAARVYGLLLDGHSKGDILDACRQLFPEHDPAALILAALDSFAAVADEPPESIKGWCLEATRTLYRKLIEVGDYEAALRAVGQLAKLAEPKKETSRRPPAPKLLPETTAAQLEALLNALPPPAAS